MTTPIAEIRGGHLERYRNELGGLIASGDYLPPTINSWFAILRVVMKAARYALEV